MDVEQHRLYLERWTKWHDQRPAKQRTSHDTPNRWYPVRMWKRSRRGRTCILLMTFHPSSTPKMGMYLDSLGNSSWSNTSSVPFSYLMACRVIAVAGGVRAYATADFRLVDRMVQWWSAGSCGGAGWPCPFVGRDVTRAHSWCEVVTGDTAVDDPFGGSGGGHVCVCVLCGAHGAHRWRSRYQNSPIDRRLWNHTSSRDTYSQAVAPAMRVLLAPPCNGTEILMFGTRVAIATGVLRCTCTDVNCEGGRLTIFSLSLTTTTTTAAAMCCTKLCTHTHRYAAR